MELDYNEGGYLNPAKCSTCGKPVVSSIKPEEDKIWQDRSVPAERDPVEEVTHKWYHVGRGGAFGSLGTRGTARQDRHHEAQPHDGRTHAQDNANYDYVADAAGRATAKLEQMDTDHHNDQFEHIMRSNHMLNKHQWPNG